jgi:TonB family protein
MTPYGLYRSLIATVFIFLTAVQQSPAEKKPKSFGFVNSQYAITAEVESDHKFLVNFVNLSDFVIVVQPSEFIYKGASGRFYIGQVFELESQSAKGEAQRYSASYLLKGHSFVGLSVVGAFHERDQIEELSVRVGAKRFFLQPMDNAAFDQLAKKIGNIDLEEENSPVALDDAALSGLGAVQSTDGTSDWDRDWQGLISPDGVNPPKILERPEISSTNEARKSRTYGKVKVSAIINKNGGIQDLRIVKSLERSLDKRVLEGIKNSWVFLPATRNGEVIDAAVAFDVEFADPAKKGQER